MKFGIIEPTAPERFDPVRHIDLAACTITIDAVATNMAMWNFSSNGWPAIRTILSAVPLSHPLWRIDQSAGEDIWGAAYDPTFAPTAPVPSFDMELIPIEAWFSDAGVVIPRCETCDMEFQNLGLLVQHCRNTHSSGTTPLQDAPASADQDAIDTDYWQKKLVCSWPGCGKAFKRRHELENHMRIHTDDRKFRCDWPGCDYSATSSSHMSVHKRTHVPDMRFKCDWPGCEYVATNPRLLAGHKTSHTQEKPWACDWPGCDKKYARSEGLIIHKKSHTGQDKFPCDRPNCKEVFTQAGNLKRHKDRKHPGWRD